MNAKKKRIIFWIIFLLLAGYFLATRISSPLPFVPPKFIRSYVTVNEVLKNPKEYDGKVIRLRGKGEFGIEMTVLRCVPSRCDCNETWGHFFLVDGIQFGETAISLDDRIEITGISCNGNECSMTCSPFYPGNKVLYELVGKIIVNYTNEQPTSLKMTNVDFESSRNLIAGRWKPLRLETSENTIR